MSQGACSAATTPSAAAARRKALSWGFVRGGIIGDQLAAI